MDGRESASSLVEMTAQKEKPGVMAPSRTRNRRESEGTQNTVGSGHVERGERVGEDNTEMKKQEHRLLETLRGEHDPRGGGEGGHRLPLTLREKPGHDDASGHLGINQAGGGGGSVGDNSPGRSNHGRARAQTQESEESSGGWSTASVSESESSSEYDSD